MDRLRTEMAGCGSCIDNSQVRKRDRGTSRDAYLKRGRTLGFKRRRAAICRCDGGTGDDNARTRGGRIVGGANRRVVAHSCVRHADVVRVRRPSSRIRRIYRSGIGNSVVTRLHCQVHREVGRAGSLDVQ